MTTRSLVVRALGIIFIFILFGLHWLSIGVFLMPKNPVRELMKSAIEPYVGSLFYQRWRLFAPDPSTSNIKLLFRCLTTQGDDNSVPWQEAGQLLLRKHYRYRLGPQGRLIRIPHKLAKTLRYELQAGSYAVVCNSEQSVCRVTLNNYEMERPTLLVVKRYVEAQCLMFSKNGGTHLRQIQFGVREETIPMPYQRSQEHSSALQDIIFPPIQLRQE